MSPELFEAVISSMFRLESDIESLQRRIDGGQLDEVGFDLVMHLRDRHKRHWDTFNKFIQEREGE